MKQYELTRPNNDWNHRIHFRQSDQGIGVTPASTQQCERNAGRDDSQDGFQDE